MSGVYNMSGSTITVGTVMWGDYSNPSEPSPKPRKRLCELTKQEHAILKIWGFLKDLYPQATGEWDTDKVVPAEPSVFSCGNIGVTGYYSMPQILHTGGIITVNSVQLKSNGMISG